MSIIEEIITQSNSHQIKPKENNLTYDSLEKIWDLSPMLLVNRPKNEQLGAKFKNTFLFLKTINFTVMSLDIN